MITRQESRQIIDFVIRELKRQQAAYITDRKIDFAKSSVGSIAFIRLVDTPNSYPTVWFPWAGKVPTVNTVGTALEWKPIDYIDGGEFTDTHEGTVESHREYVDGGAFVGYEIIDGGSF